MKGVAFPGDRLVSYVDVPDPNPGPLDVIVEMKASGMCGTDLQIIVARAIRRLTCHR